MSIAIGIAISIICFSFHIMLASKLDSLKVFDQFNVLFEADPNAVLPAFTDAPSDPNARPPLVHANLREFIGAPVRLIANIISIFSFSTVDSAKLRLKLALLVCPFFASLFYFFLHRFLIRLKFSLPMASIFTLLSFVSFSQIIFGSIPESFSISNFTIMLAFCLFSYLRGKRGFFPFLLWFILGVFAAGVTITNLVTISILFFISEIYEQKHLLKSILRTTGLAILILASTLTIYTVSQTIHGNKNINVDHEAGFVKWHVVRNPQIILNKMLTFPTPLMNSLVAPNPRVIPINYYGLSHSASDRYPDYFAFDYDYRMGLSGPLFTINNLVGTVLLVLLFIPIYKPLGFIFKPIFSHKIFSPKAATIVGMLIILFSFLLDPHLHGAKIVFGFKQYILFLCGFLIILIRWLIYFLNAHTDRVESNREILYISAASLIIIFYNFCLHSIFGSERFLYSQHWLAPLILLLSVLFGFNLRLSQGRRIGVALSFVVLVAANNALVIHHIFNTLSTY